MNELHDELLEVLERALAIPSINPPGNEALMVDYLEGLLQSYGFEVQRVATKFAGRDSLIAILPGKLAGEGIIFTGHMDVVPVSDDERSRWKSDPFSPLLKDGYLYGRGSSDMKSGLMAAVMAFCQLKKEQIVPKHDIALVATIDEEDSMVGSKAVIAHPALKDFTRVVVCEPTEFQFCTKSRGRTYGELLFRGKTAHGSRPESGCNALVLAHEFIAGMLEEDFSSFTNEYGKSFWRPLAIHAGVEPCVVPDICSLKIDARLTVGHNPDDIWQRVDKLISKLEEKYKGSAQISYEVIDRREPWECSDTALAESFEKCMRLNARPVEYSCFTGTTDGTILRRDGREVVIVGPGDLSCVHQENERVLLEDYYFAYELYRNFMIEV